MAKSGNGFYLRRVEVLTIEEFFLAYPGRAKRLRYQVFTRDNHTCVSCGIVGTHVVIWRDTTCHNGFHADLMGTRDDKNEVMLTLDHVRPKSLGGPTTFENLQTMCSPCNSRKGNKYDPDEGKQSGNEAEVCDPSEARRHSVLEWAGG